MMHAALCGVIGFTPRHFAAARGGWNAAASSQVVALPQRMFGVDVAYSARSNEGIALHVPDSIQRRIYSVSASTHWGAEQRLRWDLMYSLVALALLLP